MRCFTISYFCRFVKRGGKSKGRVVSMSKTCCIIGAGPIRSLSVPDDAFIICADGGLTSAAKFNITPDLIVGDFDSLGVVPQGENVVVYPVEKDVTDSFIAIQRGLERGCDRFVLYGCLGGRLDHTLANIQHLQYLVEHGAQGMLIGDHETVTVIKNAALHFDETRTGGISVFSLSEASEGVTIEGLYYEAKDITLTNGFPLGVSNSFIGQPATVSVQNGVLLVVTRS